MTTACSTYPPSFVGFFHHETNDTRPRNATEEPYRALTRLQNPLTGAGPPSCSTAGLTNVQSNPSCLRTSSWSLIWKLIFVQRNTSFINHVNCARDDATPKPVKLINRQNYGVKMRRLNGRKDLITINPQACAVTNFDRQALPLRRYAPSSIFCVLLLGISNRQLDNLRQRSIRTFHQAGRMMASLRMSSYSGFFVSIWCYRPVYS